MSITSKTVVKDLFEQAGEIGKTNLRLQREMLFGWSRLWQRMWTPLEGAPTPFARIRNQWTDTVHEMADKQRKLLDWEFDLAFKSLDMVMGNHNPTALAEAPAKSLNPPPAMEVPVKSKAVTPVPADPISPKAKEAALADSVAKRNIVNKVAVVTGGASGIGEAVAGELAKRGVRAVILVDRSDRVHEVAKKINEEEQRKVAVAKVGDTTDAAFRKRVFNEAAEEFGVVSICVPAAGITRDALSVRVNKETGEIEMYPVDTFRQVTEVNLIAPIYWAVEMISRIAEDRRNRGLGRWEPEENVQGAIVFLGSVSSQGNKGQLSYATAKAGLEGAAATLMKEAIFHGVRCGIIHPGFTDTPMAQALGDEFLQKYVLPYTQLRRLIRPDEIAHAICFMISNSAVSGELWADAGWHPPA